MLIVANMAFAEYFRMGVWGKACIQKRVTITHVEHSTQMEVSRSRKLFCDLCDGNFTTMTHSDSQNDESLK